MRATRDLHVRSADRLGERGSLGEMALGVGKPPRPCLDDPEVQQCDRPQLAVDRNRIVRIVGDRRIKQLHLVDDLCELAAASCQR